MTLALANYPQIIYLVSLSFGWLGFYEDSKNYFTFPLEGSPLSFQGKTFYLPANFFPGMGKRGGGPAESRTTDFQKDFQSLGLITAKAATGTSQGKDSLGLQDSGFLRRLRHQETVKSREGCSSYAYFQNPRFTSVP